MLESHYSEMFCESSLITPINQSFIAPILALYTETSCERLPMGIVQQWNLSWTATHTGVFFFLDSQKVLEETDPCINEMFGICFYDEAKLDCADLFDVTHWAMTRCYTLRASQLFHASATTSLRVIVNVMATSCNAINPLGFSCSGQPHESSCKEIFCKRSQL